MKIKLSSVLVNNQEHALSFYTEVLGFIKKIDIPLGTARWLTVMSPEETNGAELLLEPMDFAPSISYQKSLLEAGIPFTAFLVDNIEIEFDRLKKLGVNFTTEPSKQGPVAIAVFEDTCGNLIQLYQVL